MTTCYNCGNEYSRIGVHYSKGQCEYPQFSQYQKEVTRGLLMGDGNLLVRDDRVTRLRCSMVRPAYLEYLSEAVFPHTSTPVHQSKTAAQSAAITRRNSPDKTINEDNYSDVFSWSVGNPHLNQFTHWYPDGEKEFPEIKLTPTSLKHWFVGDGHKDQNNANRPRVLIRADNEIGNENKIERMFDEIGIRVSWNGDGLLAINADHAGQFFDFIGDALPGFEYKWPEGMDVSAATPDEVTVDGDEITAFGQGSPEDLRADDE